MLDCDRNKRDCKGEISYFHSVLLNALSVVFTTLVQYFIVIVCSAFKIHLQDVRSDIIPFHLYSKSSLESSILLLSS